MSDDPKPTDPVAEAQADADQAQAEADKALADPQADLEQLLDGLRTTEVQLYGIEVVQQVQQLSDADKQAFVAARLHLTSVINQLNTAQLSQIADGLEQHSADLKDGIQSLEKSLNELTGATAWASAVNSIIGVVGQFLPLL
jgi:predicted  nucleic acid-binding Zn-ribbon protein